MRIMSLRKPVITIIMIIVVSSSSRAQLPDTVKQYIDSALYIMQEKSLYAKTVNWKKVKDSTLQLAKNAQTPAAAFPALVYAFSQLKDEHGMLAGTDSFYRYPAHVNFDSVLSPAVKKAFAKGPKIVTGTVAGNIAYLRIPSMNVQNQEGIDKLATRLRDSLCKLLAASPSGIIIDLRLNGGGNSAPMLTGISPLFKKDLLGYGVDREGKFLQPSRIIDGAAADEKDLPLAHVQSSCKAGRHIPIAVLVGPGTASSGEILAVFLKQQQNVQTFGAPTAGFCNVTEGFLFMKQQGYLLLTVNRIADGKKKVYHKMQVLPAVPVSGNEDYDNIKNDAAVRAAAKWISQKKKGHYCCSGIFTVSSEKLFCTSNCIEA